MSVVRSSRWTIKVSVAGEQREWLGEPVECVWLDYWQRAGVSLIQAESASLWAKPWGDEIAQLDALDLRDNAPDWLKQLVRNHMPGGDQ